MKRVILVMLLSSVAMAEDRYVVEDGTSGTATAAANPTLIFGQDATTLVAQTCAANSCTRNEPGAATEGIRLGGVGAYRIGVAVSTGTLSGGGACELHVYDGLAWSYMLGKDLSLSGAASRSRVSWATEVNTFRSNGWRLVVRCNGVTTSAAAPTLTVSIRACLKSGCAI